MHWLRTSLLGTLAIFCSLLACEPQVQIVPSNAGSGGAAGAANNGGGSGGTTSPDSDAGTTDAADTPDAPNETAVYSIDQTLACASRPAACSQDPQNPPSPEAASAQLEALYTQCCMEVTCGCNSRCQTAMVSFDENGCATELTVLSYIGPALVDCLRKHLAEQRWECANGQVATHMPLCNPC